MSTLLDPVGPERKGVYVRRRLLVIAGLVSLVVFVVLVIVKPGSSGGAATAPKVELPAEIAAADKPEVVAEGEIVSCVASDLVVKPITDRNNYGPEEQPLLSLSVESQAEQPCAADLGTATMVFKIISGSDEVWRSTDCQTEPDSRPVILQPGKPLVTETIPWDRTRSSTETCEVPRDPVFAEGSTYHLQVSAAGVQGQGTAPFLLY